MKPIRILALALIFSIILLSGCGTGGSTTKNISSNTGSNTTANKDPYLIGVLVSQTGSGSWLGDGQLKVANMLAEQVNAQGGINGHPLKIDFYDTASSPQTAVTGASKLLNDGVVAIIGPSLMGEAKAVSPLIKDKGPIMYCVSAGYYPENRWTFATGVTILTQMETMFKYFKTKGINNIALMASTDTTGQEGVDVITKLVKADPSFKLVALERANTTDVDVTIQLKNIASKKPQAVISIMSGTLTNIVTKNFYQSGMDIPLVISGGNASYTFMNGIKDFTPKTLLMSGMKNLCWEELPDSDPSKKINEKLTTDFRNKYNVKIEQGLDYGPAMGYEAMTLVIKGLQEVGPDPEKLRTFVENTKNFYGSLGSINMSPEDHRGTTNKDEQILQIKDGKFIVVK